MSGGLYRDGLLGLKSQVAERRASLGRLEARVSEILVAVLPEPLRSSLQDLRRRADVDANTLEALNEQEIVLGHLEHALRAAVDMSFDLAAEPELPKAPPPDSPTPFLIEEPWLEDIRKRLEHDLAAFDEDAETVRWGDFDSLSTFRIDGAPAMLRLNAPPNSTSAATPSTQLNAELTMTIARGLGAFRLARESEFHRVGKWLGWVREAELGDPAFDRAYLVEVEGQLARALFTDEVRAALVAASVASPTILVRAGVLRVWWRSGSLSGALRMFQGNSLPFVEEVIHAVALMHHEAERIWS